MYKLLFESKYLIIECLIEYDLFNISFSMAHLSFSITFNLSSVSLLPCLVWNNSIFKRNVWSPPSIDFGWMFTYFFISFDYKSNYIKQHFAYKKTKLNNNDT